jgi:MGT family glycosyltransferase
VLDFLNKFESVVYIALGTNAEWTPEQAQVVVEAIKQLGSNVGFLWSIKKYQYESCLKQLEPLPTNIKIINFAPQYSVLSHAKVKLFVSHVGYNSLQESLFLAKPILAMPMFGDQVYNAKRCVERGACLQTDRSSMTASELSGKLGSMLQDSNFVKNAEIVSTMMRAAGGVKRAADLIDMSAQVGYDHLVPPFEKHDFIARHDIDVYIAVSMLFACLAAVVRRCCCSRRQSESNQTASNSNKKKKQ